MMLKLIKTIALLTMLNLVVYVNFAGVVRADEPAQTRKTNIQPDKNEFGELAGRESDALKITNIANSPSEITAVLAQDSLALVALYNSTNGPGWFHNDNWLSANPVSTWYGITVAGGRVVLVRIKENGLNGTIPPKIRDLTKLERLDLSMNNLNGQIPSEIGDLTNLKLLALYENKLSGPIPSEIGKLTNLLAIEIDANNLTGKVPTGIVNLTNLSYIRIDSNQLSDLPDLSSLPDLTYLCIGSNRFTFEDIEPNIGIPEFCYIPQAKVGETEDITEAVGASVTFSVTVGGTANRYQWYKNGVPIAGATNTNYTIQELNYSDAGTYTCQITNTIVTALTLESHPKNLYVVEGPSAITVTFPNGGENWQVGTEYVMTWTSDNYNGKVKIELSTNGGAGWWDITQGQSTSNDGRYVYQPIAQNVSRQCLIKVVATSNPSVQDQSDAVFAVRSESTTSDVTFTVTTPFSTPPEDDIYIAGSFNSWDPGPGQAGTDGQQHDLPLTKLSANQWQITLTLTPNEEVQYKYTRGSWNNYETGAGGIEIPNRVQTVPGNNFTKNDAVMCWVDLACFINMLTNGDFSDGDNGWAFYSHSPSSATGTVINGEYAVNITNGGTEKWHVQLNQYNLNIENGKRYTVAFDAYASAVRTIYTSVGKNGTPWTNYSTYEQFTISTTKQTYTYSFVMSEPTDPAARLVFDMGLSTANIFLDNIILMQIGYTSFWADVDADGDVDIIDIQLVAAHWNTKVGDPNYDAKYDVDNEGQGDGDIDIIDIQLVAAWWNQPLPPVINN